MAVASKGPRISWRASGFGLRRLLKMRIAGPLKLLANFLMFLGIGLGVGLGSSSYMVRNGNSLVTETSGPWVSWINSGRPDADPYTIAHLTNAGRLPMTSKSMRYYFAYTDDDGSYLDTGCEYSVAGIDPPGVWWSLGVYDGSGRLMANEASRFSYSGSTVMRGIDGQFQVRVSREARAGNWLPVDGSGSMVLALRVLLSGREDDQAEEAESTGGLPSVKLVGCR